MTRFNNAALQLSFAALAHSVTITPSRQVPTPVRVHVAVFIIITGLLLLSLLL